MSRASSRRIWAVRPAGEADLAAVVEIGRAESIAQVGFSDLDLATVREQIAADPAFDLARDMVVVEADAGMVATAVVNPRGARISRHPNCHLEGLAESLLGWTERRQRELGRSPLRVSANAADTATIALLRRGGYALERFYALMVRDFAATGAPEPASVPEGYVMRAIDRDADARALWVLDERAFSVLPDYEPEGLEEFVGRHLSLTAFSPEWSLVLQAPDGALAGSLIGFRRPDRAAGYVAVLAVNPDHQRRGLGRALLLSAFAAMQRAGLDSAELGVASDNPRALELYASVGMTDAARNHVYRRDP